MPTREWIFLSNTFEVQTSGSYTKMFSLASKTCSYLKAQISDPVIAELYDGFDPVFSDYTLLYTRYYRESDEKQGKTLNVETLLLNTLMKELPKWEGAIREVYTEGTSEEVSIFPDKRTPFFHGYYNQRILAVRVLAKKLQSYPLLATTALQVESFYNVLEAARGKQIGKKGSIASASTSLEMQRKLVAEALWGILGRLMDKYKKNPDYVKAFFDLSLLRKRQKKIDETLETALKAA